MYRITLLKKFMGKSIYIFQTFVSLSQHDAN